MKRVRLIVLVAVVVGGCQFPEREWDVTIEQPATQALPEDLTATLDVINEAPFVGENWAYRPEDAAVYVRSSLYFRLVEEGPFARIADPDEPADVDMTVTITEFEQEEPSASTEFHEPGKDGISNMRAKVALTGHDEDRSIVGYLVSSQAPAHEQPAGAEWLMDEAVTGIIAGLQLGGKAQTAQLD